MAGRISAIVRRWLPLVTLLTLLSGCKVLEGNSTPSWVQHPSTRQGSTTFVGHGRDANNFNARLQALSDILSQLSETVGEDVGSSGWREFSTTDELSEYGLQVTREFSSGQDTWLQAEAKTELVDSRRTSLQKTKIQQNGVIKELLDKVDAAYRENRDVDAISSLLDAIYVCATQPSSYDMQNLLDLAVSYMRAIRLSLSKRDTASAQVLVKVRRKQLLLNPKVKGASILATFDATDVWGNPRSDTLRFGSGSRGQFLFVPHSVAISDHGTVVFSIDVGSQLEKLEQVLPAESYGLLDAAYQESKVSFPYEKESKYRGETMLVMAGETGPFEKGEVRRYLSNWLNAKGVTTISVPSSGDAEEELARLKELYPERTYLLSMDVWEEKGKEIGDEPLYVVSGEIALWNLKTGTVVNRTGVMTLVEESLSQVYGEILQVVTDRFSEYL